MHKPYGVEKYSISWAKRCKFRRIGRKTKKNGFRKGKFEGKLKFLDEHASSRSDRREVCEQMWNTTFRPHRQFSSTHLHRLYTFGKLLIRRPQNNAVSPRLVDLKRSTSTKDGLIEGSTVLFFSFFFLDASWRTLRLWRVLTAVSAGTKKYVNGKW